MLARERHQAILQLIENQGAVTVADLCHRFAVSDMTIRRDLAELERAGLIRRVYGGAVSARGRSYEPPFLTRSGESQAEKERIGQAAAALIHDGDSLALDVGTTTLEVARHLKGKHNLTIVTNSLHIANALANQSDIRLILAGGILRPMLEQIKLGVDEASRLAVAERGKDTDLAVVDLAQPTIPLPGDANRVLTLFGETAFVDEKRPTPVGKVGLSLRGHLTHNAGVIPVGDTQHILHLLVVAAGNGVGHALHPDVAKSRPDDDRRTGQFAGQPQGEAPADQ